MKYSFDFNKLQEFFDDFYVLTNIRIGIWDADYNPILSSFQNNCQYCTLMQSNEKGKKLCEKYNREALEACGKSGIINIYKCHSGLVEAIFPIKMNDIIIGYIMLGQILEEEEHDTKTEELVEYLKGFDVAEDVARSSTKSISVKNKDQIKAVAKIMEACACYIYMSEMIKINRDGLLFRLDDYIVNNIKEDLSVEVLCSKFGVSKNKLYEISERIYGMGIASYIRKKRIEFAKKCLKEGISVAETAERSGFHDFNYFSKVFKKETGVIPSKFR